MADDYLKYLQGQTTDVDPYSVNPFAESPSLGVDGETPFAEELPFRFTQFAINPSAKATSGQTDRMAVGRSPFTSGALASELSGIRSQLQGMGTVGAPGEMPQAPVMPEEPVYETPSSVTTTDRSMQSPATDQNLKYGLPTRTYEIPRNLVVAGGNPLAAAQRFESIRSSLSPEQLAQLGPMESIEGYDIKTLLGEDAYNSLKSAKNVGDGEQRFLSNLELLPTTFDPMLYKTGHQTQLATRDFGQGQPVFTTPSGGEGMGPENLTFDQYFDRISAPAQSLGRSEGEEQFATLPEDPLGIRGSGITRLGDTGLYFDPTGKSSMTVGGGGLDSSLQLTQRMLYNNPEAGGFSKFAQMAIPAASFAAMGAITGGAAAPLFGSAGGLAGGLGVPAGMATTAVNSLAGLVTSVGASVAAEKAGLPMDHPLMRAAVAVAGGAAGGAIAGGAPVEGGFVPQEGDPKGIFNYLEQNNLSPGDLMDMMGEEEFIKSFGDPQQFTQAYDKFSGIGGAGISSDKSSFNIREPGLKAGSQLMGLAGADTSVGAGPGVFGSGASISPEMEQYNTDLGRYESDLSNWQKEYDAYQAFLAERQALEENYNTKMAEYLDQSSKYKNVLGLRSKQAGLSSQIQSNISSNPFYEPEENYTGIQSLFI